MRFLRGSRSVATYLFLGFLASYGQPSGATVNLSPTSLDAFGDRLHPDWALKVPGAECIYFDAEALNRDLPYLKLSPEGFAARFGAVLASQALLDDIEHAPIPFADEEDPAQWLRVHNFASDQEQNFSILEINDEAGFSNGLMAVEGIGAVEGRRVLDLYAGEDNRAPNRLRTLQSALRELAYQKGLQAAMETDNVHTLPAASQVAEIYAILRLPFKIKKGAHEDWAAMIFTQAHLPSMNERENAENPFFSVDSRAGTDGLGTTFASDHMSIIHPGLAETYANSEKSIDYRAYQIWLGLHESDFRAPRQYVGNFLERLLEPLDNKSKVKIRPSDFWTKLHKMLLSPHAQLRSVAVEHLGYMKGPEAAEIVGDIFRGPWPEADPAFLLEASYGLANFAQFSEPARVAEILEIIWNYPGDTKENLEIKSQAALSLAAYSTDALAPLAKKILLNSRDEASFISCAGRYLARVAPEEATALERRLGSEREFRKRRDQRYVASIRARTALLIGLDTPKSVQRIVDLLSTSSHERRQIPYAALIDALFTSSQNVGLKYLKWVTQYEGEGPLEASPDILEAFILDDHIDELAKTGEYATLFRSAVDELIERFFVDGQSEIQPILLWLSEEEHDGREYVADALWKAFVDNLAREGQFTELEEAIKSDDISDEDLSHATINRLEDLYAAEIDQLLDLSKSLGPRRDALRRNLEVISLYRHRMDSLPRPPNCESLSAPQ